MSKISHYEAEVMIRFAVVGPLSAGEAARAVEDRAERALGGQPGDPIEGGKIAAILVIDASLKPLPAGGHR